MLEFYFHINLYILVFWLFFHFILKKESFFQILRFYLIISIFISILLPFIYESSKSISFIYEQIPLKENISNYFETSSINNLSKSIDSTSIGYSLIIKYIIVLGSIIFLLVTVYRHSQIYFLIKKSVTIGQTSLYIRKTSKSVTPFLYNNSIVIPEFMPKEEMNVVINHEYQHYKLGHSIDNLLLQAFQIVFWINPFIYLLIRDLKQIHEYQADERVVKSGIDVSKYKLTLIKFSVGLQKFAIANGLSNYQIKERLNMMNNTNIKKWRWKFLLFIPVCMITFFVLSSATLQIDSQAYKIQQDRNNDSIKPILIELISISPDELKNVSDNDYVYVMINSESKIMIDREICSINDLSYKASNLLIQKILNDYTQSNKSLKNATATNFMFVIQKSINTDVKDYSKLLDELSLSIFNLKEILSNKIFEKSYSLLGFEEKNRINNLIHSTLYILPDKNI